MIGTLPVRGSEREMLAFISQHRTKLQELFTRNTKLAKRAGVGEEVAAITERAMRGELDFHELLLAKLTADGAEDARAARLPVVPEEDGGVLIEADVRAVRAPALLADAHDNRLDNLALLAVTAGDGVLDGGDDGITDTRIAPRAVFFLGEIASWNAWM